MSNERYKNASSAFNEKYSITAAQLLEYQSYKVEDERIFEGAAVYFESGVAGQQFPQAGDLKLVVSAGGGKTLTNLSGKTMHNRLIVVTKTAKISKVRIGEERSDELRRKLQDIDDPLGTSVRR